MTRHAMERDAWRQEKPGIRPRRGRGTSRQHGSPGGLGEEETPEEAEMGCLELNVLNRSDPWTKLDPWGGKCQFHVLSEGSDSDSDSEKEDIHDTVSNSDGDESPDLDADRPTDGFTLCPHCARSGAYSGLDLPDPKTLLSNVESARKIDSQISSKVYPRTPMPDWIPMPH